MVPVERPVADRCAHTEAAVLAEPVGVEVPLTADVADAARQLRRHGAPPGLRRAVGARVIRVRPAARARRTRRSRVGVERELERRERVGVQERLSVVGFVGAVGVALRVVGPEAEREPPPRDWASSGAGESKRRGGGVSGRDRGSGRPGVDPGGGIEQVKWKPVGRNGVLLKQNLGPLVCV